MAQSAVVLSIGTCEKEKKKRNRVMEWRRKQGRGRCCRTTKAFNMVWASDLAHTCNYSTRPTALGPLNGVPSFFLST